MFSFIQQFCPGQIILMRPSHKPYGSHSVTFHPAAMTFQPLPQPKLVLDLATQEGCKAELTWVVVISQDSLPAKSGHIP